MQAPGRDMWIAAVVQDEHNYTLHAVDTDASTRFDHRSAKSKRTLMRRPLPGWARFPAGVVATLGDDLSIPGMVAMFAGDEPAGPRYAFSVGLAVAALCHELAEVDYTPQQLHTLLERVRRGYLDA